MDDRSTTVTGAGEPPEDRIHHLPRESVGRRGLRTCIDLFAGAGGMADGFRQAGFQILSGSDVDPAASATFRVNFPEASVFVGPIGSLNGDELLSDAGIECGDLDCLIGGPPCQSFSYNNHARNHQDERARLFLDYLRVVQILRPKCLVMENVPGILTISGGAVMSAIRSCTRRLGYECDARILYAEDFGVPQQRRRVFLVATRLGVTDGLFPNGEFGPVPKPTRVGGNPWIHRWSLAPGQERRCPTTVWSAIGDLPRIGNGGGEDQATHTRRPRTTYQKEMRGSQTDLFNHVAPNLSSVQLERIKHVPEGGNWRNIPFGLLPAGMQRAKLTDHTRRYGRLRKRGLSCTILTKSDPHWGSYVHPECDRAISVREAARLQSFEDRFRFVGGRSKQFAQVGNAVPPLVARAVARSIHAHIDQAEL